MFSSCTRLPAGAKSHITLSVGESGHCDVLVIGGGPAGCTAAALIAEQGADVVLLEKALHPRFHIGESLLPRNLPILDRLGVHREVAAMGVFKPGAEFISDETGQSVTYDFTLSLDREYTHSYQVLRSEFDHALITNARRKGARVAERTAVTAVTLGQNGARARVTATDEHGVSCVFSPRLLLDASGRDAFMAGKLRLKRSNKRNSTAAVFAHFRNVKSRPGRMGSYITVHLTRDGWCWMIPLPGDIMSIGFVGGQALFKNRRVNLREFFLDRLRGSPTVCARMSEAELVSTVMSVANYSYCAKAASGDGFFIIGDAFAFIDPVFSSGVLLAMTAGELAAEVAAIWLKDVRAGLTLARQAERRLRRSMNRLSWLIHRINHPVFRDMFMAPSDMFRMRAGVVALLAGNFQDDWRDAGPLLAFKSVFYAKSLARWLSSNPSPDLSGAGE
jgi:flavin-dependent dehydrogenase